MIWGRVRERVGLTCLLKTAGAGACDVGDVDLALLDGLAHLLCKRVPGCFWQRLKPLSVAARKLHDFVFETALHGVALASSHAL